jgi:hypothetical protein
MPNPDLRASSGTPAAGAQGPIRGGIIADPPAPLRRRQRPGRRAAILAGGAAAALLIWGLAPAKDVAHVGVMLPVPAKINTRGVRTILVARFIAPENPRVDVGREFVRYAQHVLGKGTPFKILDVDPPALPEQPVEDLLKNAVFWKHIADEYGADLVLSGRIAFTNADRSGFMQEDTISPVTGQKVRSTRFVEREEFTLETNLWFFKGANGAFLYEDTFRNRQIFDGKSNDALQVFFNLAERLNPDLLGVVVPQKRQEQRSIFED